MFENYCKEYFAGLCGGNGFNNFFPEILNGIERVYILKGSPGSGKSSFMKKIAAFADENGYSKETVYCSSDPKSLDGIVMRDISAAVIDGTAPHNQDPRYPGAKEKIINLGECWNGDLLKKNRAEIISLCDSKSSAFSDAYKFLSGKSELRATVSELVSGAVLKDKMRSFAKRVFEKEAKTGSGFSIGVRVCAAIGGDGISVKNTYGNAKKIYLIRDSHDTAASLLWELILLARKGETPVIISPDAYDRKLTGAVCFPEKDVLFIRDGYCKDLYGKAVNMERFIDKKEIAKIRVRERFAIKCEDELLKGAVSSFARAAEYHNKLESLYIAAMDFEHVNRLTEGVLKEL